MDMLRLLYVVFAVGFVNIADAENKFFDIGTGLGQPVFGVPANLPVVHFDFLCEKIAREISITGRYEATYGDLHFALKLENKESVARKVEMNSMLLGLFVKQDWRMTHLQVARYNYRYKSTLQEDIPWHRKTESRFPGRLFQYGQQFKLQIYLQPSHFLILFNGAFLAREYYGYFFEETDILTSHYNEYMDSVFHNVHIEGAVTIDEIQVRTGGPITPTSKLPNSVNVKPYRNRKFYQLKITRDYDSHYVPLYDQYGALLYKPEEEYEVVIRGKVGSLTVQSSFDIIVADGPRNGNFGDILHLVSHMNSPSFLAIKSKSSYYYKTPGVYTNYPVNVTLSQQSTFNSFYNHYPKNPFKRNTEFEISIRRLSNSDQSPDYRGYPRSTAQVTVRVQCRVWTWYFDLHRYYNFEILKTYGDLRVDEVVYMS